MSSALLRGQLLHVGVLLPAALTALYVGPAAEPDSSSSHDDVPTAAAVLASSFQWCVISTVVHQLGMTAAWRLELYASTLTRLCRGRRAVALRLTACFDTTTFGLAMRYFVAATKDHCFEPGLPGKAFAALLAVVAVAALVSSLLLLGPSAISGADHFTAPGSPPPQLERRGIYAVCAHPLFYLGMLLFWAGALFRGSCNGLVLAAFMHVSALAFLHGTEIPDMCVIYGESSSKSE